MPFSRTVPLPRIRLSPVRIPILLITLLLAFTAPALATDHTLDPGDSVQDAITAADPGDTIILNPGIYGDHDIAIPWNITIRANTSSGGTAENTILDAGEAGRIFNNSLPSTSLTLDNLTLRNGSAGSGDGGAIRSDDQTSLLLSSVVVSDCTAGSGGGIYNTGTAIFRSVLLDHCHAQNGGGVYNAGTITEITGTTFSSCSVDDLPSPGGGGLLNAGTIGSITSSEFLSCTVGGTWTPAGGGIRNTGTIAGIVSSNFSSCNAWIGGAIDNADTGTIGAVASSRFSSSAGFGGGINNDGTIGPIAAVFSGCSAVDNGGAISNQGQISAISDSVFSGCTAQNGGAIANANFATISSLRSSTFTGCSASQHGGSIINWNAALAMDFCRISSSGGIPPIYNEGDPFNASYNWWGTNGDPSGFTEGGVTVSPWLVMNISATPAAIHLNETSAIRVNLKNASDGTDTTAGGIFVPAIPVTFAVSGRPGSCAPAEGMTGNGTNTTTFIPAEGGTAVIYATADSETISVPVWVAYPQYIRVIPVGDRKFGDTIEFRTVTNVSVGETVEWTVSPADSPNSPAQGGSGQVIAGSGGLNQTVFGISDMMPYPGMYLLNVSVQAYRTWGNASFRLMVAPAAGFAASPRTGLYPLTVRFFDQSTNTPTSWRWNFGDGSAVNSTVKNPVHTYTRPGVFTVTLQATNAGGSNSTMKTGFINVTAPAPSVAAITPARGNQGAFVVIQNLSGTEFRTGARVFFNRSGSAIAATNVTIAGATRITCTVKIPATAPIGTWNVTVRNTDGKSGTRANAFTVRTPAPPTVTGVTPASGRRGILITITNLSGTGFVANPKPAVQFIKNGTVITATNVTVANPQKIFCTVKFPALAATGPWTARVTNADNQSGARAGGFTLL